MAPAIDRSELRTWSWPVMSLGLLEPFTDERGVATRPDRRVFRVNDNGRALALAVGRPRDAFAATLAESSLAQLIHSDRSESGLAVRGIAVAAARAPWSQLRRVARELFETSRSSRFSTPDSWAHAALGAATVLRHATYSSVAAFVLARECEAHLNEAAGSALIAHARCELALLSGTGSIEHELEPLDQIDRHARARGFLDLGARAEQSTQGVADTVDAFAAAFRNTHEPRWADAALFAGEWFLGRNSIGLPIWDPRQRLAHDGIAGGELRPATTSEPLLSILQTLSIVRSLRR